MIRIAIARHRIEKKSHRAMYARCDSFWCATNDQVVAQFLHHDRLQSLNGVLVDGVTKDDFHGSSGSCDKGV